MHETISVWIDREPTLDEELRALGEDDIFDMANLPESHTGVPGVIMISTAMGSHDPRVKYYLKTGRHQPSFSVAIASEPRVVANSLSERDMAKAAPAVIAWVRLNHEKLARFWWDGPDWMEPDVRAFMDTLERV